jgi:hypothetical protein
VRLFHGRHGGRQKLNCIGLVIQKPAPFRLSINWHLSNGAINNFDFDEHVIPHGKQNICGIPLTLFIFMIFVSLPSCMD